MGKPEEVLEGPPNICLTRRAIAEGARKSGEKSDCWQAMKLEDNEIEGQRHVI